jgi:hypothetical protein
MCAELLWMARASSVVLRVRRETGVIDERAMVDRSWSRISRRPLEDHHVMIRYGGACQPVRHDSDI